MSTLERTRFVRRRQRSKLSTSFQKFAQVLESACGGDKTSGWVMPSLLPSC